MKTFEGFEEEFGVNPEFKRIGYLFLASTPQEMDVFMENVKLEQKVGVPVDVLSSHGIEKRWPYLRVDDIMGGTFCLQDGYAGPSEVLAGFAKGARRAGAKIYEMTESLGISLKGDNVGGVRTKDGEISSPIVVNAAGPYASAIGDMVGVKIPVKPLRRQVFVTAPFRLTDQPVPLTIDFHR